MKKLIVISILFLSFVLFSCSRSDVVEISSFSPTGKIERLVTFEIEFNKDLASSEIIDKWVDDEFIQFEPKINGKFKWIDSRTLIKRVLFEAEEEQQT